jgi:hypothetical protein
LATDPVEPTERCDACGKEIPLARYRLHVRGLDGATPECPKQDLVEIAMRKRGEWEPMRRRFQEIPAERLRRIVWGF